MIDVRNHNDYAAQAALQGVKLEFKKVKRQIEEMSVEQKQIMSDVIKKATQRKLDEMAKERKRGSQ